MRNAIKYISILQKRFAEVDINFFEKIKTLYRPLYSPIDVLTQAIKKKPKILEVGCGSGPIIFLLYDLKLISAAVGIDINKRSIGIANSAVKKTENIQFKKISIYEIADFKSYSTIILFDLLHHLNSDEQIKMLNYIFLNANSGTQIIIKDLSSKPAFKAWFNKLTDYLSTKSKVTYIDIKNIIDIAQSKKTTKIYEYNKFNSLWSHYYLIFKKT